MLGTLTAILVAAIGGVLLPTTQTAVFATGGDRKTITLEPSAAAHSSKTILIAGDIAGCGWSGDSATAKLVAKRRGLVMTAGDNAYPHGSSRELDACYGPTWGRFKRRTRPTPGNHDYATPGATGYFAYFGKKAGPKRRGFYAFDHGAWRIYALDSNCAVTRGCKPGSAQYRWLKRDMERNPRECVMAVLHHPHFSSGRHGNSGKPRELVKLLYKAGAEIIVNGHDHIYERFAPAKPWGGIDREHGVRQFIVGTGGAPLYAYKDGRPAHSRKRTNRTHGVLELNLETSAYRWTFLPTHQVGFADQGRDACHGPPPQQHR